jgi:putative secretion ATPase (PEP-CTERM system associated)
MYERFYHLRERPFALSPDPDYLYPSRVHREALDYLRFGIESQAGFVVITGEIGSGKTTLLQTLLRGLDSETTVGRIVNTMLEPRELLETMMIDFGLDPAGRGKPAMLRDLAQFLVEQHTAGRLVLLVVDEAQNLSRPALEEIRMLSNLETEKSKLLHVVLVGQPNLRDTLASPELEQLRQRITVSYHLEPLDARDTASYIHHRLRRAALGVPLEFPLEVTDRIHARSRGIPRIINVISDAALVFGYAENRASIDPPLLEDVLTELEFTGVLPAEQPARSGGRACAEAEDAMRTAADPRAAAPRDAAQAATPPAAPMRAQVPDTPPAGSWATGLSQPAVPAQADRFAREVQLREERLARREQELQQRERELTDQKRILATEYRLLRSRHTPPAQPPWQPAAPAVTTFAHVAAPAGAHGPYGLPERRPGFWGRVRRALLGVPQVVGD